MSRIADALRKSRRAEAGPVEGPNADRVNAVPPDDDDRPFGDEPWSLGDRNGPPPPREPARQRRRDAAPLTFAVRRMATQPVVYSNEGHWGGHVPSAPPSEPVLLRYWEVVQRRWRTGLGILLVVVSGVAAGSWLRTPVYRASGLLEIRRESATAVPVETLFTSERLSSDDLETQYGILKSRALAERVLAALGRKPPAGVGTSGGRSDAPAGETAPPVSAPRSVEAFQGALVVNPHKGSRLVEVSYATHNPQLAALTVNSVLDAYLQMRMEEADRSAKWLERQLADAQRRLEASERQLHAYFTEHGLRAVETGKGEAAEYANERLAELHQALAAAQAERIAKQSADEEARRLTDARGVDSRVVQDLMVRLADLRREHAKLSSTFKEDYPAVKTLTSQIAELERALDEESRLVVSRGERDYRAALRKEALLRQALDQQSALVQALGADSQGRAGYQTLRRELVTNQEQFASLSQKLQQVSVSAALKAANVGIVDRARPPSRPDGIPLPISLALGTMVGLLVATGGMFVRDHFDTSMRTVAEVQEYLGVRALGTIPAVRGQALAPPAGGSLVRTRYWRPRIDDRGERQSPLGEAFATLRNAMLLQDGAADSRVLLVTSAQSEEGKTTVSINLALSLARLNYRVLLVDGNMRYPCIQRALGLPDRLGLVEYLSKGSDWRASLHREVQPNLDVLGGDEPQASPADLLSLPRMGQLFDAASREYDFVIVDSPAMLSHPADVHSLAAVVDNVLFTIRQGFTPRAAVSLALSQLDRVSGVVLNRLTGPDLAFRPAGFSQGPSPTPEA